jgi:hypothetical protein
LSNAPSQPSFSLSVAAERRALANERNDFQDPESQRVLDDAADALVGELARQAAREQLTAMRERP